MEIPATGTFTTDKVLFEISAYEGYDPELGSVFFYSLPLLTNFSSFQMQIGSMEVSREVYLDVVLHGVRAMCEKFAEITERPDIFLSEDRIRVTMTGNANTITEFDAVEEEV